MTDPIYIHRSYIVDRVAIFQDGEFIGYRTYEEGQKWISRTDNERTTPDYEGVI